jgi:hypothetical protein
MPLGRKRLHEELVKAAERFRLREPWKQFADAEAFAIRIRGEEHTAIASIQKELLEALGLDGGR